MDIKQSKILILDYGSQYTQLIARRVRELDVYCEIYAWDAGTEDIKAYDCYVAFFGTEIPIRKPSEKPYVLRYAASSLRITEPSPHALMLRDTVIEMKDHLSDLTGETDFDRGYAMAYDFATKTLKRQCDVFGLRDDLGWMEPDVSKWLREE